MLEGWKQAGKNVRRVAGERREARKQHDTEPHHNTRTFLGPSLRTPTTDIAPVVSLPISPLSLYLLAFPLSLSIALSLSLSLSLSLTLATLSSCSPHFVQGEALSIT